MVSQVEFPYCASQGECHTKLSGRFVAIVSGQGTPASQPKPCLAREKVADSLEPSRLAGLSRFSLASGGFLVTSHPVALAPDIEHGVVHETVHRGTGDHLVGGELDSL